MYIAYKGHDMQSYCVWWMWKVPAKCILPHKCLVLLSSTGRHVWEQYFKSVFNGLHRLHQQGFPTWIGRTCALAEQYDIDLNGMMVMSTETFKAHCSEVIKRNFINRWKSDLCNTESRILKTYAPYKCDFNTESYLEVISVPKYRIALSKLRSSSHNLEIERGRYVRPKKILDERVCMLCKVVDDEIHFVTSWTSCEFHIHVYVPAYILTRYASVWGTLD